MKKLETFKVNKTVLFCFAAVLFELLFGLARNAIYVFALVKDDGSNLYYLIREAVLLIPVFLTAFFTNQIKPLKWNERGFFNGLQAGMFLIVTYALFAYAGTTILVEDKYDFKSVGDIILFAGLLVVTAAVEEVLYRGIVFDSLLSKYAGTGKGLFFAIAFSSILFGLSHITNLFTTDNTKEVILQIIQMLFFGAFLAAVYYRGRSLYVTMIIHILFDFVAKCTGGLVEGASIGDEGDGHNTVYIVIVSAMYLFITIFIMRASKRKKERKENPV